MSKNYLLFLSGYVGYYVFSTNFIQSTLEDYKGKEVDILMNSSGGSTFSGMAIAAVLKNHGSVNIHMIGLCASAATIASMGAKKITMDAGGLYLVHKCKTLVDSFEYMNTDQLDNYIKNLEKQKEENNKIDLAVASMYSQRCKKSKKELFDLMSKDCILTAQEALEWGLIDEITNYEEDKFTDQAISLISSASHSDVKPEKIGSGFLRSVEKFFLGKNTHTKNNTDMKEYPSLSALGFDTAGLVSQEKEAQFDAAESVAKGLVSEIDDLKNQVDSLTKQVESLSGQPAQTPANVVSSGAAPQSGPRSYADICKEANEMLNALS